MKSEQRTHIAQQATELANLARTEGLEFLGYLLEMAAHEAKGRGDKVVSLNSPGAFADAGYLRDQAARCMRLAREYRDSPISHDLEVLGIELMEKASELDRYLSGQARAGAQR